MAKRFINNASEQEIKTLIRKSQYEKAKQKIAKNLESEPQNPRLYKLLIDIYRKKKDYANTIKTINMAIRKTDKKKGFRELKKGCILEKMIKYISSCKC